MLRRRGSRLGCKRFLETRRILRIRLCFSKTFSLEPNPLPASTATFAEVPLVYQTFRINQYQGHAPIRKGGEPPESMISRRAPPRGPHVNRQMPGSDSSAQEPQLGIRGRYGPKDDSFSTSFWSYLLRLLPHNANGPSCFFIVYLFLTL
jgi:hypothetical protein